MSENAEAFLSPLFDDEHFDGFPARHQLQAEFIQKDLFQTIGPIKSEIDVEEICKPGVIDYWNLQGVLEKRAQARDGLVYTGKSART